MNDILEFFDIKKKPIIYFPLLDEALKIFQKLGIDGYNIHYNVLRFRYHRSDFTVRYDDKENRYSFEEEAYDIFLIIESKEFVEELEHHIKFYSWWI